MQSVTKKDHHLQIRKERGLNFENTNSNKAARKDSEIIKKSVCDEYSLDIRSIIETMTFIKIVKFVFFTNLI